MLDPPVGALAVGSGPGLG